MQGALLFRCDSVRFVQNKVGVDKMKEKAGSIAATAIELVSMVEQFQMKSEGENTPHVVGLTRCTVRQCRDLSGGNVPLANADGH